MTCLIVILTNYAYMLLTRMSSHIATGLFMCALCAGIARGESMHSSLRDYQDSQGKWDNQDRLQQWSDSTAKELKNVTVMGQAASKPVTATAPTHQVDAAKLFTAGITDVADAIHHLPGATLRDYGGAGGLKTVSVRGFGAGHTSVTYDGVPLSDIQSGAIDLSRYTLENLDKLSLVIGDNEDIFTTARAAASAASLQIATMSLADTAFSLNAKMKVGSFDYYNPYLRVAAPISKTLEFVALGEFIHADNDYPFTLINGNLKTKERRNNSRMNSGHGEANLRWRQRSLGTFDLKAYYYNNKRRLPGPVIYYNSESNERLHEENFFGQLSYRGQVANKWLLKAVAKFNWAASLYHDENGKYPGGILDQNYYQREAYTSAALLWLPTQNWNADYSVDYSFNNLTSNLKSDVKPYRHSVLQSLTAKYSDRHLTLMARLLCSLYYNGARRGEGAKDARKLSPSISASVHPWLCQNLYFRASYKQIFRMPSFNECYFDHYGSTNVLPETTNQVNLGLTYSAKSTSWLPEATFTLDGYINHVNDMIVCVPYNMFVWTVVNLNKVRTFGVDATANVTFRVASKHSLVLSANYSFQRAEPRTSPESSEWMKQVAYIPKHSGAASLAWENPWINLSAHATGVSDRYTTNNNLPATRISGYIEAGFTAWRQFPLPRRQSLEVRADLINAFNKQYEVVARYPMPGRSWQISLSYKL